MMLTRYHSYYCYLNQGQPVVQEHEPDGFVELPYHYATQCPSFDIAKRVYDAELKIRNWRSFAEAHPA
ncbi:hypothetical protein WDW89_11885 [Deltaproteobacteria bacterium TL4]